MERVTYPLKFPLERESYEGDETRRVLVRELELAPRVKGRHMRQGDGARGPAERQIWLIASLAGISRAEADELDSDDIVEISEMYEGGGPLDRVAKALGLTMPVPVEMILAAILALQTTANGAPTADPKSAGPKAGKHSSGT